MALPNAIQKLRLSDPHAELPIKNHKYIKNCTELYLSSKRIDKIANFDAFVNLEVLWINDNQIQHLDGLDKCFRLKRLYAQNNHIRSLDGSSLRHFTFLQELRLYDNKLKDLKGTLNVLSRLSYLRDLDLFGNAVVEEENYRLQVIRAIPSLRVLDRHVITDQERAKAARLQVHPDEDGDPITLHSSQQKQKTMQSTAPQSQELSGTVKLLFHEVAVAKRQQQKEAIKAVEREHQELARTQQRDLSSTHSSIRRNINNNTRVDEIQGLVDWEVASLKKHFQSLEGEPNSGVVKENLHRVFQYLRTRGYVVSYDGFSLEDKSNGLAKLENILPASGNTQWKWLMQLFESKQLQCAVMPAQELQQQASICFDKCAELQRRLQALDPEDAKSAHLIKESLGLSQQGYRLQALAEDSTSSSRSKSSPVPSTADINDTSEPVASLTPRTRFYMTSYSREKTSSPNDRCSNISELKAEREHITEALAGKYKIRQKDFTKYLTKQSSHSTKLVRRNYQL